MTPHLGTRQTVYHFASFGQASKESCCLFQYYRTSTEWSQPLPLPAPWTKELFYLPVFQTNSFACDLDLASARRPTITWNHFLQSASFPQGAPLLVGMRNFLSAVVMVTGQHHRYSEERPWSSVVICPAVHEYMGSRLSIILGIPWKEEETMSQSAGSFTTYANMAAVLIM